MTPSPHGAGPASQPAASAAAAAGAARSAAAGGSLADRVLRSINASQPPLAQQQQQQQQQHVAAARRGYSVGPTVGSKPLHLQLELAGRSQDLLLRPSGDSPAGPLDQAAAFGSAEPSLSPPPPEHTGRRNVAGVGEPEPQLSPLVSLRCKRGCHCRFQPCWHTAICLPAQQLSCG